MVEVTGPKDDMTDVECDETALFPAESLARIFLKKLRRVDTWEKRAQVKRAELDIDSLIDDDRDDFLPDLLPFKDHPDFLDTPEELKKKILSCGWLAYNEKTINIEADIITPMCLQIINGDVPGLEDWVSRHLAGQTLVDESYHVLLVVKACQVTRERRGLLHLKLPSAQLVTKMRSTQAQCSEKWQQTLVQLATSIVSEVFISDYLKLLSNDLSIQPFNRMTVDTHRRDELAHGSLFRDIAKNTYMALSERERAFFIEILPQPVCWFANLELHVWEAMLQQIEFPKASAVINDCKGLNKDNLARVNYSGLISLAEELGIFNAQRGIESFGREGLMS